MKTGLLTKLLIAFVATGILVATAAEYLVEQQTKKALVRWIEDEMSAQAGIISLMTMEEIAEHADRLAERNRSRLTLIDASGRVITDTDGRGGEMDNHLNRPEIQEARLKGKGTSIRHSRNLQREMLYVAYLLGDQHQPKGYVRLSRPLQEVTGPIDQMRQTLLQDLRLVIFFSLLIALLFSYRLISPIRKLAAFTEKVRRGGIAGKIRMASRDEIGMLAENIGDIVEVLNEKIRSADEEHRKLQSVFAGMVEGVVVLDSRDRIESVNRGMEEMIGPRSAEMYGRTLIEAFRNIPLKDALDRFRASRKKTVQEITLDDENPVVLDVTISALQGNGNGEKTLLVFHDVTRLKKLERIRTDFVANVTHEIRTPLTAIIGFVETLQQGALEDRSKTWEFLRTINENAQRLNRLVDDLLTLTDIELGKTKLLLERQTVEAALDRALAVVTERISEKKLSLQKKIPPDLPPVRTDRDRLMQILLNILDNAVKFTPEGGTITVMASPGVTDDVIVRIADTGIGIPTREIPRLGERFYRADKARSRGLGGTGLGLSIVKHLLKELQGRMTIESSWGGGTTVSLHFPVFFEEQR